MAGMVFAKYPTLDIPPELERIKTNVDGGSLSLVGQARQAFLMLLLKGRGGLLADYPYVPSDEYKPTKPHKRRSKTVKTAFNAPIPPNPHITSNTPQNP